MRRTLSLSATAVSLIAAIGCTASRHDRLDALSLAEHVSHNRPGIAIVASGGIAGWEHVTLLDSATARYVTVTRRACHSGCAPLDSASGTLSAADVARIYAIADAERATLRRDGVVACVSCEDMALVTTAVFGNRRRSVVRSDRETSPQVFGRVNVALAEAIRAARTLSAPGEWTSTAP